MPRFFCEEVVEGRALITGEDARHIQRVLRKVPGDILELCDLQGQDYDACILQMTLETIELQVIGQTPTTTEPTVAVHIFQGYPKKDKFETIVQKAVELGVCEITPVFTHRCVARPDSQAMCKNRQRAERVAFEAAKQSGRGRLPKVHDALTFDEALLAAKCYDLRLMFYEAGGAPLSSQLHEMPTAVAVFIGPEGGFEHVEVEKAAAAGVQICTLGRRILRCETAPLAVLAAIMYATGNLE